MNFRINGRHILVPMATEEPSVIAACNGAAKTIAQHGGFECKTSARNIAEGHILLDIGHLHADQVVATVCPHETTFVCYKLAHGFVDTKQCTQSNKSNERFIP